jgi:hypothetical protein
MDRPEIREISDIEKDIKQFKHRALYTMSGILERELAQTKYILELERYKETHPPALLHPDQWSDEDWVNYSNSGKAPTE